jgi:hypothetical protein
MQISNINKKKLEFKQYNSINLINLKIIWMIDKNIVCKIIYLKKNIKTTTYKIDLG